MSGGWRDSDRGARLPADWAALRQFVLDRDGHQCRVLGCTEAASDVDHTQAGDNHDPSNLASLCATHHRRKSSAEGNAARWRHRQTRPAEQHPGLR